MFLLLLCKKPATPGDTVFGFVERGSKLSRLIALQLHRPQVLNELVSVQNDQCQMPYRHAHKKSETPQSTGTVPLLAAQSQITFD